MIFLLNEILDLFGVLKKNFMIVFNTKGVLARQPQFELKTAKSKMFVFV